MMCPHGEQTLTRPRPAHRLGASSPRRARRSLWDEWGLGPAVQAGLGGGRRVADTGAHGATVRDWQGPEQPHSVHRDRSVPGPFQVSNAAPDAAPHPPSAALHEPSFWKCSQIPGKKDKAMSPFLPDATAPGMPVGSSRPAVVRQMDRQ